MTGTGRSLGRKRVTLQAQQVHLAHTQVPGIGRSVGRVTTAAALSFYWDMFIDKRTCFIRVAFCADGIAAGQCPYLPERRRSVDVMTIRALHEAFVDSMVVRLAEVSLCGCVTAIAELGLRGGQQVFHFLRVVWGVAVQAADITAAMS